ncbi:hypothetical protein BDU57DRAFT_512591 [Ampelomyces quisqualis]|uniref:Uncharacterized protein n=1 Tax=Ampelomyces quisqualis TaxID=50730 RepID=A0A6A5QUJ2_AMPQU|nr:hypothetical protein BDU57DRAFT_512591 [Ampelomyces quisqualis]
MPGRFRVPNVARNVLVRVRSRSFKLPFQNVGKALLRRRVFRPAAQSWTRTTFSTRSGLCILLFVRVLTCLCWRRSCDIPASTRLSLDISQSLTTWFDCLRVICFFLNAGSSDRALVRFKRTLTRIQTLQHVQIMCCQMVRQANTWETIFSSL